MKSVIRTLAVLEEVARRQPVAVGELAQSMGLPKSTVQRTLVTLDEAGWLRATMDGTRRWEVGTRALAIRSAAGQSADLIAWSRPWLITLRDEVGETVHLSVPDGLRGMIVIDRVDCVHVVRAFHAVGDVSSMIDTASGRAILAHCSATAVREAIALDAARRHGEAPADVEALQQHLLQVRADGFSVSRGTSDVCAIAAPILRGDGTPLAAVTISIPMSRFDPSALPASCDRVRAVVAEISSQTSA